MIFCYANNISKEQSPEFSKKVKFSDTTSSETNKNKVKPQCSKYKLKVYIKENLVWKVKLDIALAKMKLFFSFYILRMHAGLESRCWDNTPFSLRRLITEMISISWLCNTWRLFSIFNGKLVSLQSATVLLQYINMSINKQCDLLNLCSELFVTINKPKLFQ